MRLKNILGDVATLRLGAGHDKIIHCGDTCAAPVSDKSSILKERQASETNLSTDARRHRFLTRGIIALRILEAA
jgi:hypothetical protein